MASIIKLTLGGYAAYAAISEESIYKKFLDPERAHNVAIFLTKHRLVPRMDYSDPDTLKVKVFGKEFSNPIGMAAGLDKDAKAVLGFRDIGFGFVEIGSVTPNPQPGNEKPRVFRLNKDSGVINRYGFNRVGHDKVLKNIQNIRNEDKSLIIGINLEKNKTSVDPVGDYVQGINKFGLIADYLVINVSSPNTPGLRVKDALKQLLTATVEAENKLTNKNKPQLLLKLAPDVSPEEIRDIAEVLKLNSCRDCDKYFLKWGLYLF